MTWAEMTDWREWGIRSRGFIAAILATLIALVLLAGWFGLLQGRYRTYQLGKGQEQSLNLALSGNSQALHLHESARLALDDATLQLRDARWRLAAGVNMSDLLDELTSSGHAHGLVFEQLDVEQARVETGYQMVPLRVEVVGRYAALRMWLDEWFGQVRLLRATSLRLVDLPERPGLLRLQVQVASYHPGEELPAPASLAHEPARPAARPPRVDLFVPWSTQAAVTGLAGVPWISWRWSAACRRLGITRLCCGRLDGCIGCVLGTVWGVMRVSWYGSIDTRSRCASVCSSRECGTSGRSTWPWESGSTTRSWMTLNKLKIGMVMAMLSSPAATASLYRGEPLS